MKKEFSILIAEDDQGHFRLIKRNLSRFGFKSNIHHFADGAALLDFLYNRRGVSGRKVGVNYLLLLDIRMPKVDGIEVLRQIKQDKDLMNLPVIMLTSSNDTREITKCVALGCSEYIIKPLKYDAFEETMQRVVDSLIYNIIDIAK